jgi:oligopeptide transport system substrate-binding protein
MKKRCFRFLLAAFLILAPMALSGCSQSASARFEPDCLRVNLGAEPPSLDWHTSTDSTSFDVVSNIMVGLTRYTDALKVEPGVASSWDVLDGGKRYVFHLRKDVKWTDGKTLVAGDFEYAWKRLLNPKTAAQYAFFLYGIENAEAYNSGHIKDASAVGVKALDNYTLEVKLAHPEAYFIYLTAYAPCSPMRKDVVERWGDRWTEPAHIVTNGPFRLKHWQHEYKIELAANPTYYLGAPKLKLIKMFMVPEQATAFALYENNELDFIDNRSFSTSDIDANKNSPEYSNFPVLRNAYIGFNNSKAPFTDPRVRRAISMSVERRVMPKILRRGERPVYTWIPPQLPGYDSKDGITYDPAEGRRLLAEAGYPDGRNFPDLDLLYPNREDVQLFVEKVQDQLKTNLGIHINLQNMEWKMFLGTLHHDPPPIFYSSWGADYPDPETFANLFVSTNGNNDVRLKNPQYDHLIAQAETEQDAAKRAALYSRADRLLTKELAAMAPMMQAAQNVMVKPWVHGISKNALDLQFFGNVHISAR